MPKNSPLNFQSKKKAFPRILLSSQTQDHETPRSFFDPIQKVFKFQLDPCTTANNPLGLKYFLTERSDGLKHDWLYDAFINPPFISTKHFLKKTIEQVNKNKITVGFLCASRTDTKAMQRLAFPNAKAICFIRGRLSFKDPRIDFSKNNLCTVCRRLFPKAIKFCDSCKIEKNGKKKKKPLQSKPNSSTFPCVFMIFKRGGSVTKAQYEALAKVGYTIEQPSAIVRGLAAEDKPEDLSI